MAKVGLTALGLLFSHTLFGAPPALQDEGTAAWKFTCTSVAVDSCTISCPCLMGLEPHHGTCHFVMGFKIKDGHYGNVSLDGISWAMTGEFTGARNVKFDYVAFYLPKDAKEEQKKALRSIFGSSPFSDLPKPLAITEVDLQVMVPSQQLGVYELKIGDKGSFTITPVTGTNPGEPIKVKNPVYPFPVPEITVGRAEGRFRDHGKELELTANSGEIGMFTLSSKPSETK
jgi:hypothetical protein